MGQKRPIHLLLSKTYAKQVARLMSNNFKQLVDIEERTEMMSAIVHH
jgi:hypothetical protein